jgi:hypothetical protein
MTYYRLFHITPGGSVCRCQEVIAPDDGSAIESSRHIASSGCAELWCEKRLVHAFAQVDGPLAAQQNSPLFESWSRS